MSEKSFYDKYWQGKCKRAGFFEETPEWPEGLLEKKLEWVKPFLKKGFLAKKRFGEASQSKALQSGKRMLTQKPFLSGRWLDAGCGSGEFANALSRHAQAFGIDISRTAIEKAEKRFLRVKFKQGSVTEIPFEKNFFDGIVAFEIIEHVLDTDAMFSEFNRVLKKGGFLCITTPQFTRLKAVLIAVSCLDKYFEPESPHIRYYTLNNLKKELSMHGFEIEHYMPDGFFFSGFPKGMFIAARKTR